MRETAEHMSIGQVAALSGISTRTLRHYESIGLLPPTGRGPNGYRLYSPSDRARLADILVLRQLDLPLSDIADVIDGADSRESLLHRHALALRAQAERIGGLIASVENQIAAIQKGEAVNDEELFNGFTENPYEDEAREQWGNTDAYRESTRRAKTYGPEDWKRFQNEMESINDRLVTAMNSGDAPSSEHVMDIVDEHRKLIDQWFYPCSHEFHRNLGDMYIADPRFTANIDKAGEGLAAYMRVAIAANADRAAGR